MANVLVLKSSINGETSLTNQLINEFLAARQAAGHGDRLTEHDLSAMALPNAGSPPVRRPARGSWIRSLLSARRSPSPTSLSPS
ncbi:FMN-dependent NADH-azoreductase [Klebsiella pneumoniae]|nr:FMN-dependent NADH-azoreductase [Klebsiella pneumoniae]